MPAIPSAVLFNLAGTTVYLAVAVLALLAARGRTARETVHWIAVAAIFIGLAAWRVGHGEDLAEDWARRAIHAAGAYGRRRDLQGPVIGALMLAGLAGFLMLALRRGTAPLVRWSRLAALGLLGYSLLRALSFHPLDALLYAPLAGALRLNHVIDMGLAVLGGGCACRTLCR